MLTTTILASILATTPSNELPADVVKIQRVADPAYAPAIEHAVEVVGRPDLEIELWRVCRRESWCGRYGVVGVHAGDAWVGGKAYAKRVANGDLDPVTCPGHQVTEERPVESFATRGGFGTIAAGVLHTLGPCVAPEALDDPWFAAEAAARSMASCRRWAGEPGDRHRRSCTCRERARKWAGAGKWASRSNAANRRATIRQCGPDQPPLSTLERLEDAVDALGRAGLVLVRHSWAWLTTPPSQRTDRS